MDVSVEVPWRQESRTTLLGLSVRNRSVVCSVAINPQLMARRSSTVTLLGYLSSSHLAACLVLATCASGGRVSKDEGPG